MSTFNPWVEIDESKIEYASYAEMLANYRRPTTLHGSVGGPSQRRIYVLEYEGFVKIGISANPKPRIQALHRLGPIHRIFISPHECMTYRYEVKLHNEFEHDRIDRELFAATYDEVLSVIRSKFPQLLGNR